MAEPRPPDAALAERMEERLRAWGVRPDSTRETESSLVAFGTRGGQPVVVKLVRRRGDEWDSGAVLAAFGGRGMVRVLGHVPGAMLLERLHPATLLAGMAIAGRDDEATEILADVIGRISTPAPPPPGCATVEEWARSFDRYLASGDTRIERGLAGHARGVYRELCASQREPRLLHGDLQHYNVLLDARRGWTAIDPKGVAGEAEYELGAALRNPVERPELFASAAAVERRLAIFRARLGIDVDRARAWAFAQAVLSAIWGAEDGFDVRPDDPPLLLAAAIRPLLRGT
ncbi:aminoglycoside phosphotransferase family protein [Longimicrobium sp.]|uniref:aminoglycoside phosphotransferase family protein n=1 Tax=Longimicrobium sp. TaxID=2029185 RepID=UPI002BA83818|nr:aminoglycoside phosphotransferase family protein [Longimicrobium sp.]HSU16106.1 aminoglycoside phosphotransferase family protein [Longimicrobium sp.]